MELHRRGLKLLKRSPLRFTPCLDGRRLLSGPHAEATRQSSFVNSDSYGPVMECVSKVTVADQNLAGNMDLRTQQSNGGLSEFGTVSARNVYQSTHSPRVSITGGVITSALSDRTSITLATDIANYLPNDNSTSRANDPSVQSGDAGRYGVSVAALHKRPRRKQDQYAVSREDQYAVFKIWKYNILEDIKRGPYFKKPPIRQYSEEEVVETMAETMEQYMSKTRADYGSGIARPKIDDKDSFELKSQFLKELRDNTFSGSDHEDANEHIEKVLKIVDLFHIPNITQEQVMLKAFPMSLARATSRCLRNKPSGSITTLEDLKTKFLSKYCPPARTANKMKEINNFQKEPDETLYQEVILFYNGLDVQTRQILDSKAIQAQLNNLRREIKKVNEKVYAAQVGCEQYLSKEEDIEQQLQDCNRETMQTLRTKNEGNLCKVLRERGFGSLPRSTEANLRDHVKSISTTAKANSNSIHHIGSPQYAISTPQNRRFMFESRQTTIPFLSRLNDYYCEKKKGSYGLQFSEAYSYEASHINKSIPQKEKDPGSFTLPRYINNFCFDNALADLGASLSVMPLSTYLNLGLGELAQTKLIVELADRTVKYTKGIAENVLVDKGSRAIGGELGKVSGVVFSPQVTVTKVLAALDRSREDDQYVCLPSALCSKSVAVLLVENMDGYRDQDMGDIILVEPFCKASCVEAKRFDGLITIHNGSDNVSLHDNLNGILLPYQKLKSFYKGVLNLGPEYVRDVKMEEWLTRGHISVYEIE
ncbi:hypothetical protein Tco_0777452, partial [Tanacetum coccineum]